MFRAGRRARACQARRLARDWRPGSGSAVLGANPFTATVADAGAERRERLDPRTAALVEKQTRLVASRPSTWTNSAECCSPI
ncbi:MAG TPA: hypothetical protein VII63_10965 [Caulobacteraceae bacterium]